jgi:hypothetical protein
MDDYFEDGEFMDDDFQPDEFDGLDEDFGEPSDHADPSYDDVPDCIDWDDFTLGMGLGQELAHGERRTKRRDEDL